MQVDSIKRTLMVALGVCIVCSILVSAAAVSLRGVQEENRKLDRIRNILMAGALLVENADIRAIYEDKVMPVMINLSTGQIVPEKDLNEILNIDKFDIRKLAGDSVYGMEIPSNMDTAKINRMPKYMVIYLIREKERTHKVVLPIYGKGLWSTMYGFIALADDLKTVKGIAFYEHAETPGLGGEVDNERWKKSWNGKQVFDVDGNLKLRVIKGTVDISSLEARHQIDGLSGATLTSRGVDNLVRFWLGENGYGPFLKRFKEDLNG
jgi:Na+-transporting NADH:ubiquinone oxidoreductase subunit C